MRENARDVQEVQCDLHHAWPSLLCLLEAKSAVVQRREASPARPTRLINEPEPELLVESDQIA